MCYPALCTSQPSEKIIYWVFLYLHMGLSAHLLGINPLPLKSIAHLFILFFFFLFCFFILLTNIGKLVQVHHCLVPFSCNSSKIPSPWISYPLYMGVQSSWEIFWPNEARIKGMSDGVISAETQFWKSGPVLFISISGRDRHIWLLVLHLYSMVSNILQIIYNG